MKQQASNIATVHIPCHMLITHPRVPQYLLPLASCFMPLLLSLLLLVVSNPCLQLYAFLSLTSRPCSIILASFLLSLISCLLRSAPCLLSSTSFHLSLISTVRYASYLLPLLSLLLLTAYLLSSASELQPLSSISISRVHIISSYVDRDSNICLPTSHHHYFTNCFMVCQ